MHLLIRWVLSAVALYLTVYLGQILHLGLSMNGPVAALIAVVALAAVNATIRPLLKLVTMPITCVTFGLFAFVINALMFWLVGALVPGFHVTSFVAALFGSVVMSAASALLNQLVVQDKERDRGRR